MILEDESQSKSNDKNAIQQLTFRKIGGFNLLVDRPFITDDHEHILIVSKNKIRKYYAKNGNFLNEYYFGIDQSSIVSIQRCNDNPNECLIAFGDGHIIQWNYDENYRISETSIKIHNLQKEREKITYFKRVNNVYYVALKRRKKANEIRNLFYYYYLNDLSNRLKFDDDQEFVKALTNKTVAIHSNGRLCAIIQKNKLLIYELPRTKKSLRKEFGKNTVKTKKYYTSLAFHPTEPILAIGDSKGRIHIWNDLLGERIAKSVLHWHSQSVLDLAYSPTGTSLYSAGYEMVLVKWNLIGKNYGEKLYLPRLGDKICFITTDQKNKFLITSHADHIIRIIDSQMTGVRAVIEGLTFADNLQCGLHYNPRLKAIVMNGRVGHIQLYSPFDQRQLFQFDITQQNIINVPDVRVDNKKIKTTQDGGGSGDRDNFIPIRISCIAINDNGDWMATSEYRNDHKTSPEIRLKFWLLHRDNNGFTLNTTVHLPHDDDINYMEFSLTQESSSYLHLITTSLDKTFKIWDLLHCSERRRKWWNCSRTCSMNQCLTPRMASFSSDSSLLSVLFGANMITMWELNNYSPEEQSSSIRYIPRMDIFDIIDDDNDDSSNETPKRRPNNETIFLSFGRKTLQHYLIEVKRFTVTIYDVIKKFAKIFDCELSKSTNVPMRSVRMDHNDNSMALIYDYNVKFFCLNRLRIIANINIMNMENFKGKIMAALFWPVLTENDDGDDIVNEEDLMNVDNDSSSNNNTENDLIQMKFNGNFICITDNNELFHAIPIDSSFKKGNKILLDDYSESTMVGTHNDLCNELFIKNLENRNHLLSTLMIDHNSQMDNDNSNIDHHNQNDQIKSSKQLIDKYFFQIPAHVLPPIQLLEKKFFNDYLKMIRSSSSSSTVNPNNRMNIVNDDDDQGNQRNNPVNNETMDNESNKFESKDSKIKINLNTFIVTNEINETIDDNHQDDDTINGNEFHWLNKFIIEDNGNK